MSKSNLKGWSVWHISSLCLFVSTICTAFCTKYLIVLPTKWCHRLCTTTLTYVSDCHVALSKVPPSPGHPSIVGLGIAYDVHRSRFRKSKLLCCVCHLKWTSSCKEHCWECEHSCREEVDFLLSTIFSYNALHIYHACGSSRSCHFGVCCVVFCQADCLILPIHSSVQSQV